MGQGATLRIIISCIHYPVSSGRYMANAFRRIGCEVRTLGDSTGAQIWGGTLDDKYIWRSDGDLTTRWHDWRPDLIVHMDSAFAYHHSYYADVPHVVYGVDNHVRDYRQTGIERYFLAHKAVSVMAWSDFREEIVDGELGASIHPHTDMEWLPCGYDPTYFTPSPIAWDEREYDVAMIGVMYPRRAELLNALSKAGLKVLGGTGWVYEQYATAYHSSRISLCVSANGDLAQRVFETAAMGCAILTDPIADLTNEDTNKVLGLKGFAIYDDVESAVSIAQELLDDTPQEHQPIAEGEKIVMQLAGAGMGKFGARMMQESVLGKHTWDARARRIVEWWEQTYGVDKANNVGDVRRSNKRARLEQGIESKHPAIAEIEIEASIPATQKAPAKPKRKRRGQ